MSDRLISSRLKGRNCKVTVLQCYGPTNEDCEDEKDNPKHDVLIIMGDLNAKVTFFMMTTYSFLIDAETSLIPKIY